MCELAFQDAGSLATMTYPSGTGRRGPPSPTGFSPRPVVVSDAEYRSWEAAVERARAQSSPEKMCQYVRYA
jgi:hypothetical protein